MCSGGESNPQTSKNDYARSADYYYSIWCPCASSTLGANVNVCYVPDITLMDFIEKIITCICETSIAGGYQLARNKMRSVL